MKLFWLFNFSDLFWNCVPDADGYGIKISKSITVFNRDLCTVKPLIVNTPD